MNPAKIFPSLVKALGWTGREADYSLKLSASYLNYDLATRSWRTSERSLFGDSIEFSGALPRSGTMRNGKIFAPQMLERPTAGKGFGLWPTPRTAGMCGGTGNWNQLKAKCESIDEARKMGAGNGGKLNPQFPEWLMGFPIDWTALDASVTASSRKLPN